MRKNLFICLLLIAFTCSMASAQIITDFVRNGSSEPDRIAEPLTDGALCFMDRTHVYKNVPSYLEGFEYIKTNNADRTYNNLEMSITVSEDCTLYLFLDNRIGDGDNTNPATGIGTYNIMYWVGDLGYTFTGDLIDIDEGNNGSIDNSFSIYSMDVSAGTHNLYEQMEGGINMYGIAAVPEPMTLTLLGLGGLALVRRKRKM